MKITISNGKEVFLSKYNLVLGESGQGKTQFLEEIEKKIKTSSRVSMYPRWTESLYRFYMHPVEAVKQNGEHTALVVADWEISRDKRSQWLMSALRKVGYEGKLSITLKVWPYYAVSFDPPIENTAYQQVVTHLVATRLPGNPVMLEHPGAFLSENNMYNLVSLILEANKTIFIETQSQSLLDSVSKKILSGEVNPSSFAVFSISKGKISNLAFNRKGELK